MGAQWRFARVPFCFHGRLGYIFWQRQASRVSHRDVQVVEEKGGNAMEGTEDLAEWGKEKQRDSKRTRDSSVEHD